MPLPCLTSEPPVPPFDSAVGDHAGKGRIVGRADRQAVAAQQDRRAGNTSEILDRARAIGAGDIQARAGPGEGHTARRGDAAIVVEQERRPRPDRRRAGIAVDPGQRLRGIGRERRSAVARDDTREGATASGDGERLAAQYDAAKARAARVEQAADRSAAGGARDIEGRLAGGARRESQVERVGDRTRSCQDQARPLVDPA